MVSVEQAKISFELRLSQNKTRRTLLELVQQIEERPSLAAILNARGLVGDVVDIRKSTVIVLLGLWVKRGESARRSELASERSTYSVGEAEHSGGEIDENERLVERGAEPHLVGVESFLLSGGSEHLGRGDLPQAMLIADD
jgi:hypothetical protein